MFFILKIYQTSKAIECVWYHSKQPTRYYEEKLSPICLLMTL